MMQKQKEEMTHGEIDLLLPWYVNGTISGEDRHRVEEHLQECAQCRQEILFLQGLEEAVQMEPTFAPSSDLLRKTLARLEKRGKGFWDRIAEWLAPPPRLRWAVVVVGFAIVLQTAIIIGLMSIPSEKTYEVLSVPSTQQATGPRIVLAFQENITESMMRETLQAFHAQIVAGPSPLGFYTVELPQEEAGSVDKRLEELRAKKGVIRFAERAQ